ncbi:hypothetical protein BH18CHL2_BH18CHL2_10730 [soil metagenome]
MIEDLDEREPADPALVWLARVRALATRRRILASALGALIGLALFAVSDAARSPGPDAGGLTLVTAPSAVAPANAPPSASGGARTVTPFLGFGELRATSVPGANYDLVFTVTAGPFSPPAAPERLTYVYRADLRAGRAELIGRWSAAQREALVFPAPEGDLMVVSTQNALELVRRGVGALTGPPQDVRTAVFLRETRPNADPFGRVIVSTPDAVLDVTSPDRPNRLAAIGGDLLGRLPDGRLVLAALSQPRETMVVSAVTLDGSVEELGRIPRALGHASLQPLPPGPSVLVLRTVAPGEPGGRVVAALNFERGELLDLQVIGQDGTYAAHDGDFVFAQPLDRGLACRGSRCFGPLPEGRSAVLDAGRSWSPDDAFLAFRTTRRGGRHDGLLVYRSHGELALDLEVFLLDPEPRTTVSGWVRRQGG